MIHVKCNIEALPVQTFPIDCDPDEGPNLELDFNAEPSPQAVKYLEVPPGGTLPVDCDEGPN